MCIRKTPASFPLQCTPWSTKHDGDGDDDGGGERGRGRENLEGLEEVVSHEAGEAIVAEGADGGGVLVGVGGDREIP